MMQNKLSVKYSTAGYIYPRKKGGSWIKCKKILVQRVRLNQWFTLVYTEKQVLCDLQARGSVITPEWVTSKNFHIKQYLKYQVLCESQLQRTHKQKVACLQLSSRQEKEKYNLCSCLQLLDVVPRVNWGERNPQQLSMLCRLTDLRHANPPDLQKTRNTSLQGF